MEQKSVFHMIFRPHGKSGTGSLIVTRDGKTIFCNELNINNASDRERTVGELCREMPGLCADDIRSELLGCIPPTVAGSEQTQSTMLLELLSDAELFHTPGADGAAYATINVNDHKETWPIDSREFEHLAQHKFYGKYRKTISNYMLRDALNTLKGKARFESPEGKVAVRVAEHDGAVYLDLCENQWRVVRITRDGWELTTTSPVKFIRCNGMNPLPEPVRGGDIAELKPLLNLESRADFALLATWAVAALSARGPFPILVLNGVQGSAKSTTSLFLRELIDPNHSTLRTEPGEVRDLMVSAKNSWVLGFDNISHITPAISDAFCQISTSGSFSKRELHSNDREVLFNAMRPILLNGIEEVTTRADLLDRCICLTLPRIDDSVRKPLAELKAEFYAKRPHFLGALLDALSTALRNRSSVKLQRLPRMADFAILGVAAEHGLGLDDGQFIEAYMENRRRTDEIAIEASPIGSALLAFMQIEEEWRGTVLDLLNILSDRRNRSNELRCSSWPRTAHKFSADLRRLTPNLRKHDIEVDFSEKGNRGRMVVLRRIAAQQRTA